MRRFSVWDESGTRIEIEAASASEAAQEYVDGGDWPDDGCTRFHRIWTEDAAGETESHDIVVEPEEPACDLDGGHFWREVAVSGHGGGVLVTERCRCGCYRETDTWATNPTTGEQGVRRVEYSHEADE